MTLHSDVDLRGFSYVLAPVQRQANWRFERLQREVGAVQQQVSEGEARLTQMRAAHAQHASDLAHGWERRADPTGHARGLAFLGQSGKRIDAQVHQVATDRERLSQAQRACLQAQLRIEGMDRHEQEAIAVFAAEQRRRLAVEADRDWAARGVVRQAEYAAPSQGHGSRP